MAIDVIVPLSLVHVTFEVSETTSVKAADGDAMVIILDTVVQNGLAVSVTVTV